MPAKPAAGIKGLASGRSDLFRLNPDLMVVKDDWNARDFEDPDNIAHVERLAESIREVGVKEPLTVYMEDGHPVLTNGESRLRAVRLLQSQGVEVPSVPVQTEPKHASEADKLASQIVRNSGRPFSVLEQSQVFVRLSALGWEDKVIASRSGLTTERVRQIMSLNQAPKATRKLIQQGKVSATVVQRIVAKAKDPKDIDTKVKAAVAKATAEGKSKAGPRHVEKTKPAKKPEVKSTAADFKKALKTVVDGTNVPAGTYGEDELAFTLVVAEDTWDAIKRLLK